MNKQKTTKTYPELISSLHPTKNENITLHNLTAGSHKLAWWKCNVADDHVWETSVSTMVRSLKNQTATKGCPFCHGTKVTESNSLAIKNPEITTSWSLEKNTLTPFEVTEKSNKIVWWKCNKGDDHIWKSSVNNRIKRNCPYCSGKRVSKDTNLYNMSYDIALQWHPTKNGLLTPMEVTPGSNKYAWWLCEKGHEYKTKIYHRSAGSLCPYCSGNKLSKERSLLVKRPDLAKEFHPTKNGPLDSSQVHASSGKKVWWRCMVNSTHEWESTIDNRNKGNNCPHCNSGWTIENIRQIVVSLLPVLNTFNEAELFVLMQQNGLLDISNNAKGKLFVQALQTGKFPKDELKKFAEGQSSLVDKLISKQSELKELQGDNLLAPENAISEIELDNESIPYTIEAKDTLTSMDDPTLANLDQEVINFFILSGVAKLWGHAFKDENAALCQVQEFKNDGLYSQEVKNLFLLDYNGTKQLKIPIGYSFPEQPNLMQMYTAYLVKTRKRIGNWSGTGAGKTRSAILASRIINAKITIICCPNNVISNWELNINKIAPNSVMHIKEIPHIIDYTKPQYIILNYEFFSQSYVENRLSRFLKNHQVDFIIIDEIHFSKQREENKSSLRKEVIASLLSQAAKDNADLHVLGMSATPVLNNLLEARSLIELITGVHHKDLPTKATVQNCITMFQKIISHGTRWVPNYNNQLNIEKKEIDCGQFINEIRQNNTSGSYVDLEVILTKAKIPFILANLKSKTIVYTHYHRESRIIHMLKDAIEKQNWKVALFTGETKEGLETFIKGDADILISSSCIMTGIDGLQTVCDRLIINSLPWTHAEFQQLVGRIYRQGQTSHQVDIIIPITYANINETKWSYCKSRWNRIEFKRSIADAAVDGIIPVGHLRTHDQAYKDIMQWLERLDRGEIYEVERQKIQLSLSDSSTQKSLRKIGDLSQMNRRINHETSAQTHQRFLNNPSEWDDYHATYRENRKDWEIVPYEEAIKWCKDRSDYVVGDFGCGEAFLVKDLANKVYSFDHVAINDSVIACDIREVPLDNDTLNVAIFSLSLMGTNFVDYLKEARRCLKLDGHLWIAEPTSRIIDIDLFKKLLERLGFDVRLVNAKGKFTFIEALKSAREINEQMVKSLMEQPILD